MNNETRPVQPDTPTAPISSGSADKLLGTRQMDAPTAPGTLGKLDRFDVLRVLGQGGMGQVLLAREPVTDSKVAIKMIRPEFAEDATARHRFLTEARHMYRMAHPNILKVMEVSERAEGPYFVMPFIPGGSLADRVKPGQPMPESEILRVARQVASAIEYAHSRGITHRDLKPANILLDTENHAYLTDFGLMRTQFNDSIVDVQGSQVEGTVAYMSPAVAEGKAEDTRCDLYAFGALLYEMLTGQPPYQGTTPLAVLRQIVAGPPRPILEVNPAAPAGLVRIAESAMARELHDRYASMTDVVADLDRVAAGEAPLGPHGLSKVRQTPSSVAWKLAIAAAVVLLAAGIWWSGMHFGGRAASRAVSPGTAPAARRPPSVSEKPMSPGGPSSPTAAATADSGPPGPAEAPAPDLTGDKTEGPFTYKIADGKATITKYTGPGGNVTIPATLDGVPVTAIDYAFAYCGSLTDVTIPDTVTFIGGRSFIGTSLTRIRIPPRVTSIGWQVFCGAKLTSVDIPASVTDIGQQAFAGTNLTSVTIPEGVTAIGYWAFAGCPKLSSVRISRSVTSVNLAFVGCADLVSITVDEQNAAYSSFEGILFSKDRRELIEYPAGRPGSDYVIPDFVTSIGKEAFGSLGGGFVGSKNLVGVTLSKNVTRIGDGALARLKSVTVSPDNPVFRSVDGVVFNKDGTCLIAHPNEMPGLYVVPKGVTRIGNSAFIGYGLPSCVVVADTVTTIGADAFYCSNLAGVYFTGNVPTLGNGVFAGAEKTTVYYRAGATGWGKEFGGRPTAVWDPDKPFTYTSDNKAVTITRYAHPDEKVTIPAKIGNLPVTSIAEGAFRNCRHVTSITIPDSVTRIGRSAFEGCISLTNLQVPDSVVRIEPYAFNGCSALVEIKLPTELANLEQGVFQGCAALSKIAIPEKVIGIADAVFNGCAKLDGIDIPAAVVTANPTAFNGCTSLTAISVKDGNAALSSVDGVLFSKDKSTLVAYPRGRVGDYTIPDSVTAIAPRAFETCGDLTNVVIPDKVSVISYHAFNGCGKLVGVKFPATLTTIEDLAFCFCGNLRGITLPAGLASRGYAAFWNCSAMTVAKFPDGLTSIGDAAFRYCSKLTEVALGVKAATLGNNPFIQCEGVTEFRVDEANPVLQVADGVLFDRTKAQLICYPAGRRGAYTVPAGTRSIRASAFQCHSGITRMAIPDGIEHLDSWTFGGCPVLTTVIVPATLNAIASHALRDCASLTGLYFHGNAPTVDSTALAGSAKATVYRRAGATGWGKEFGGRPTAVWDPDKPFTYTSDNKAVTITRYAHPDEKVTIPAKIDNLPVTTIAEGAFRNCRHVTSITIPDSVTHIGRSAFEGCVSLTGISVPDSVVRIEPYALNGCSALADVKLPAKLLNLEQGVFYNCNELGKIAIPGTLIGIADDVFTNCYSLASIEIPANIVNLGRTSFTWCRSLKAITVKDGNPAFTSVDGVVFSKDKTTIVTYPRGRPGDYTIPDTVTAIRENAFESCAELTNVVIPNKISVISDNAFHCCSKLVGVKFPASLTSIGEQAFNYCESLAEANLPAGVTSIGTGAFYNCRSMTRIIIGARVASIGESALSKCHSIGAFVVEDGNPAFSTVDGVLFDNTKSQLVRYPGGRKGDYAVPVGTKSIRARAFEYHFGVTSVTVPEGVERVEANTFGGCPELTTVTIPASVKTVAGNALGGCANLTGLYFHGDAPTVDKTALAGSAKAIVYYRPGTKGWGPEFGGRPTAVWDRKTPPAGQAEKK